MKNLKLLFFLTTLIFVITSCARIYSSPDAEARAKAHKIIAVVPPKVSIAASRKIDAEAMKEQQKTESFNFQREMYSWLLRRKTQQRINVELLDVETTNAKLAKAGYFNGTPLTPNEIAETLGVDGVITSNYSLSKPISEGAAIAVGLLAGAWGPTNSTAVTVEIHDKQTKKMLWNFNHKISGSIGSTPAQLVDNLMRYASRKMPYTN